MFLTLGIGFTPLAVKHNNVPTSAVETYVTNADTYYKDITAEGGKQLAAQLHDLITSTHDFYTSYDDNGRNGHQKQTDQYYENGQKVNGYIYEFYSGVKWPNAWEPTAGNTSGGYNREHCWCQSNSVNAAGVQMWGEKGGGADMHHLRPVEIRLNSTRNNNVYGEISNRDSYKVYAKFGTNQTYALGGYCSGGVFEPIDSKKGDVARIILYTYLHYNSYTISTLFGNFGTTNGGGSASFFSTSLLSVTKTTNKKTEADALKMLLDWNKFDPVDDIERQRNEQVASIQGNRNPFIDNSDYANLIWNSDSPVVPVVNSVTVLPSSAELFLGNKNTQQLTVNVSVSYGAPQTVTWSSSNDKVAKVSNSGLVTAVGAGSCSIIATSTYNTNKSGSCAVKVSDDSKGDFVWDLSIASFDSDASTQLVTWSHPYAKLQHIKGDGGTTDANNYLGGKDGRTSSRFYKNNILKVTPLDSHEISKIEFTATSTDYATALYQSSWVNATANVSGSIVTIVPIVTDSIFYATLSAACGVKTVKVYYLTGEETSPLVSISLNISNVQTIFSVGDKFDSSGLIVTAHYEDGTEDTVSPTTISNPNMSTLGKKNITVTYVEKEVIATSSYEIIVNELVPTYIIATVSKTYHPGEKIVSNDISVEDDLGNKILKFSFTFENYIFSYEDTNSGDNPKQKIFENCIKYLDFTCDLNVLVSRIDYHELENKTDVMTQSWTGVTGTSYKEWGSQKTLASGVFYYGKTAGGNSDNPNTIQLRTKNSDCGIISTVNDTKFYASFIEVEFSTNTPAGNSLSVYGRNDGAYTSVSDLYNEDLQGVLIGNITKGNSTALVIPNLYRYIGFRSAGNAIYLKQINIKYENGDNAVNVSNYIMIEDTPGQCSGEEGKLNLALKKLNRLPEEEKNTFLTSSNYVIATARERIKAWAIHEGKEVAFDSTNFVLDSNYDSMLITRENENISVLVIVLSVSFICVSGCLILRSKKKRH